MPFNFGSSLEVGGKKLSDKEKEEAEQKLNKGKGSSTFNFGGNVEVGGEIYDDDHKHKTELTPGNDRSSEIEGLVVKELGVDSSKVTVTKERVEDMFQYKIQVNTEDLDGKNLYTALVADGLFVHSRTNNPTYTTLYVS